MHKQVISEEECLKIHSNVKELLAESCNLAQERIVKLLDGKNKVVFI